MRTALLLTGLAFFAIAPVSAKTVVFWQEDFPTVESQPVARASLATALQEPVFDDLDALLQPHALDGADLLVLPNGSTFPADTWPAIIAYLRGGGNLLVLGGRAFRIPVARVQGRFVPQKPSAAYQRMLGIRHTYIVPQKNEKRFVWRHGYSFLPSVQIQASRYFVLQGRLNGLGYMLDGSGDRVAAPVVVFDHTSAGGGMLGGRWVMLDFTPAKGYWDSPSGITLIRAAAGYASQGASIFSIDTEFSTLKPGEVPEAVVHFRNARRGRRHLPQTGSVTLQLVHGTAVLASKQIPCSGTTVDATVAFVKNLPSGFYLLRGLYKDNGATREFYENGFWVEDEHLLTSGPALGVNGDFLTKGGKPFFPVGANYFSTEENGWDFSGPRNAAVWEHDFAAMERHDVTLVRTGVWGGQIKFIERGYGGVTERFLRNVEAFLLCARRHHIAVNFTFFAFDPQTMLRLRQTLPAVKLPGRNPYLDPVTVRAEQEYILSIVNRFKNVPDLSWDLINEPSFSNPAQLWKGNTPHADPSEIAAWHAWLRKRYGSIDSLAAAWGVTRDSLGNFGAVPLPSDRDLTFNLEHGSVAQVRAFDFNLFAQETFANWVHEMVQAIRSTGSTQIIDVGQDEGGVTNRVLNQFYAHAGLSFTTNHTYRENQNLLWDSLAAKSPGIPNIVGETGFQPNILPNGAWQFDEIEARNLLERKWAYAFAGAASGVMPWDWDREVYFGLERSDGSNKVWIRMLHRIGEFASKAAPSAIKLIPPQIAIVLPQSLQLSTLGRLSIQAQQNAVRALYGYARADAYCVGEYQLNLLGDPKLIIVPSPWLLNQNSWEAILAKVRAGATLLISGRFDQDAHFRPTGRQDKIGIPYRPGRLQLRNQQITWPGGSAHLIFDDEETNYLERAFLPNGQTFVEKTVGSGKILFVPLPIELNQSLAAIGKVYRYAMQTAGVVPAYSTNITDPGILICPTRFPHATLYVITSETTAQQVSFRDQASGKQFSSQLGAGRAALLLVSDTGTVIASYDWRQPD
ncbi:MAG: beta-galactosidase [Bryobacteraceae bacterium]